MLDRRGRIFSDRSASYLEVLDFALPRGAYLPIGALFRRQLELRTGARRRIEFGRIARRSAGLGTSRER
jgi:hypothetical protein